MGYFTEIEMLQNKIKQLEAKLEQERQEFREAFMRIKTASSMCMSSSSNVYQNHPFYEEICFLREENALLKEELADLKAQK